MSVSAPPLRDLYIGRLGLPTIQDPITEQLGSDVSTVGDYTAVGNRKTKGFTFNWYVQALGEPNAVNVGNSMRRRLRSLVQNEQYRLGGIYMQFAPDSERNGWLVIGDANLVDNDGGVTFGSYQLSLQQAYMVGNQATHREGYRVDLVEINQAGQPVDYLGGVINVAGDFSAMTAMPLSFTPAGSYDQTVLEQPLAQGQRVSSAGVVTVVPNRSGGDVVSWERPDSAFNGYDDVIVYDRRGNNTPDDPIPSP
jgi:hypothetical protein